MTTKCLFPGIKVAIDASRGRSGGAKAHLIGFLEEADPKKFGVDEIHVWSYSGLLKSLPERDWLYVHSDADLERGLVSQLIWQKTKLAKEIESKGCHVVLSTDAGTVKVFHPSVVMSRDMLSFERSEIARYKQLGAWLRLFVLRFVQSRSLKKADGALFLTEYASKTIQTWTGPIKNQRIIPHGVGKTFKNNTRANPWPEQNERNIHCLYISNTAMYKHQWHVVEAFKMLRDEGYPVEIEFVGGGQGLSNDRLNQSIKEHDPKGEFTSRYEFLPHAELPSKLASADLFVFASSCENMPNTLVEAMSCGLPIACSELGPMPEVLKNGGVYFKPENSESIKDGIKLLLNNAEQRETFAARAKVLSENYSWRRCSDETLEYLVNIYQSSINLNT